MFKRKKKNSFSVIYSNYSSTSKKILSFFRNLSLYFLSSSCCIIFLKISSFYFFLFLFLSIIEFKKILHNDYFLIEIAIHILHFAIYILDFAL